MQNCCECFQLAKNWLLRFLVAKGVAERDIILCCLPWVLLKDDDDFTVLSGARADS